MAVAENTREMVMTRDVRVAYVKFLPYLDVEKHEGETVLTGIIGGLTMLIIEALNLNATFVEPVDGVFGVELPNGSWSGKMGMLVRNEADFTGGPLMLTTSRTEAAQPSFPISYIDVVIFAGRPFYFTEEVFAFLRAFTGTVWLGTALAFLAIWAVYVGISTVSAAPRCAQPGGNGLLHIMKHGSILESFDMLASTLLSQGKPAN
ncbi:glutamate receptor-like [Dermacentor silvarum]|uniref:glutamate receptor-like n=1 Tax=Dermacentor silvarum TaxID=543639 RepID=UPI00210068B9|nr:glutamate receptor-like [Dermacentor silvarum]